MNVFPAVRQAISAAIQTPFNKGSGGGAASIIAGLFAQGQQGFWLPFTDFASLTQDSAGTLPYTALEQPVGLIYDKSRGGALGAELLINGNFATDSVWSKGVGWTIVGGKAYADGTNVSASYLTQPCTTKLGQMYEVGFDYVVTAGRLRTNGAVVSTLLGVGAGNFKGRFVAPNNGLTNFLIQAVDAGSVLTVWNVTFKEVLGNHATQVTSTARGVVSARVNLLEQTAVVNNSLPWIPGAGVSANGNVVTFTGQGQIMSQSMTTYAGVGASVTASALLSGSGTIYLAAARRAGGGVYEEAPIKVTLTATPTRYSTTLTIVNTGHTGFTFYLATAADGTARIVTIGEPSLTYTNQASLPYQRVNTPTDYDSVGFPKYLRLDGTDDFYTCSGGGSTTGFYYSDVIRPMGGAGTARFLMSDRIAGPTGYIVSLSAANKLQVLFGGGGIYTVCVSTDSIDVGNQYFIEAFDDGVNLQVVVNGGTPVTVPRPATPTYGGSAIMLYKNTINNDAIYNGQITEPIYRAGPPPSAYERGVIRTYQMQKAGML